MAESTAPADPVEVLSRLVSFRTDVVHGDERALAVYLAEALRQRGADDVIVADAARADGKPASFAYARFGTPKLLVNAHLDTVPPNADWSSDPFTARVEGGRVFGLGTADTKGAIAAILCALEDEAPRDTGILFSGDEEFSGVAMRAFLTGPHRAGLTQAIVCEPTNLRMGVRHRGYVALEVDVTGPGGHSSRADSVRAPLAILSRIAVRLDEWALERRDVGPQGFPGTCLNVARVDGGIAFNVIPAHGRLSVSLRPPPGADTDALRAELEALIHGVEADAEVRFVRNNAPFATADAASFEPLLGDVARGPVDLAFWTEAALLVASGVDAVVLGPGDIAQAHAPDEWVTVEELTRTRELFRAVFAGTHGDARSPRSS